MGAANSLKGLTLIVALLRLCPARLGERYLPLNSSLLLLHVLPRVRIGAHRGGQLTEWPCAPLPGAARIWCVTHPLSPASPDGRAQSSARHSAALSGLPSIPLHRWGVRG